MFVPIRPAMRQIEIDRSEACDQSLSPMSDQGSMMIVCACASRGRGRALARARPRSVITHTHSFFLCAHITHVPVIIRSHQRCTLLLDPSSTICRASGWCLLRLMVVQSQHLEVDWVTSDTGQRALRMAKLAMPLSKLATGHHAVRHPRAPTVNSLLARTAVDLFN